MAPSGSGHYDHAQASQGLNSVKWLLQKMRDVVPLTWVLMAMISPVAAQQVTVERDSELRAEARLDAEQMRLLDRYAASRADA